MTIALPIKSQRNGIQDLFSKAVETDLEYKLNAIDIKHLTKRERDIIRLLAKGFSSKQISESLDISKNTVENHRQDVLRKTVCGSHAEVVAYALKFGFL